MIEFKLPALGENIEQGDLVRLMIAPGAAVSEGQAVMELETDKAVVEVPSSVSGTVKEILVKEGEKIKVGQVIFTADSNGTSGSGNRSPARASRKNRPRSVPRIRSGWNQHPAAATAEKFQSSAAANIQRETQPTSSNKRSTDKPGAQPNSVCRSSEKISPKAIWCA